MAWQFAKKYWDVPIEKFPEFELPTTWDWRNVKDYDFTTPVKDQGGCGSCYVLSTITSIESRAKIITGLSQ